MSAKTVGYLILYGGFLILMGVLGYFSNPEKAKTALITGGVFGVLSILWGFLGARGFNWSRWAAVFTTGLLALACIWRAFLSWSAVINGESNKTFAALVITAMLAASVVLLPVLLKRTANERGS